VKEREEALPAAPERRRGAEPEATQSAAPERRGGAEPEAIQSAAPERRGGAEPEATQSAAPERRGGLSRAATWLILAIAIAPYFVRLQVPDLCDVNETLYAEPPREALETGEWLVPTMNYVPWFVKPPGVTWVTLPFYAVLGPSELAGRLPMALAAALVVLLTWRIGVRTAGEGAGLLAALVLATASKNFLFSRQLAGDVLLTLSLLLAALGYLRWYLSDGERRGGLWLAATSLGLGTLMKGPIALLLPALFVPLHLRVAGRWSLWHRLRPAGPGLLALVLGLPWFVYAAWQYGDEFLGTYFGRHHFERFFTDHLGSRGLLYYPTVFLADLLPWGAALPGAAWVCWRTPLRRSEPWRSACVWGALLLVFFSLSRSKREIYLMPVYPFAALVIGTAVDHVARADCWRKARWIVGPLLPVALAALGVASWCALAQPSLRPAAAGAALLGAVWLCLLLPRLRRHDARGAVHITAGVMVGGLLWTTMHLDLLQAERPAREFAQYIEAHGNEGDLTGRYLVGMYSLCFYGHRPCFSAHDAQSLRQQCLRAPQSWIAMPAERLADVADAPGLQAEVALQREYLQVSSAALLGQKPLTRPLLLVRVTPRQ
jgi:4-amino-4-deoxy-L-arabinose transferase-like glycosyltransferase